MDIRNTRALKKTAAQRLESSAEAKKIVLIYAGIVVLASILVTVVNYCLDLQISQSGGLGKLGIRSFLSTTQTVLPIAQSLALLCLELGYMAAMLRVARKQYVSPQTLRAGMPRFWALLRCSLLQSLIYMGISIVSVYLAMQIFLITPLAADTMKILVPLANDTTALSGTSIILDEATQLELMSTMTPVFVLFGIFFCALALPISYQYRMANYVLLDKPACGALAAMRESRMMMKRNRFKLFRLDLSMWWYYLAVAAASVVCYGDMVLALFDVALPWSDTVSYFVFYGLYLLMLLGIYYFLMNRVEVTYALAYDSIRPKEQENTGGVVLGNIFDM